MSQQTGYNSLLLSSGHYMPILGMGCFFGTAGDWKEEDVVDLVKEAISAGYRLFDSSPMGGTGAAIGNAVKAKIDDGTVTRADIFLTMKLGWTNYHPEHIRPALQASLATLGTDYIDLYQIQTPFGFKHNALQQIATSKVEDPLNILHDILEADPECDTLDHTIDHLTTWKVLEDCVKEGMIRSIGVCNFNSQQVQNLVDNAQIKPSVNQIEVHPYLRNERLVQFCQRRNVQVTGFTSLGQPHSSWSPDNWQSPLQESVIKNLAVKYCKTPAQIALRYQVQRNIAVIPKTVTVARLKENINIFDFNMNEEDMSQITSLDLGRRALVCPVASSHKEYPFNEEY